MTQYDDERAILERMYPDRSRSQERFDAFVKAGISYTTRGNEADRMRRDAQSLRTNDIDSWLDYDLARHEADEFEAQGEPGDVLEEGPGNVGTRTRYNDAGDPMPVVDDQQSAVAENVSDGDYGAVYDDDGKLIDRLNPKEEHDRYRRMNHDMNEEYARAGEAKADPMELEEVSEEVVEEDPEERRRLDLMKSRMSKEEWDKFLNSINPKAIEEIKARYGIDLTKETKD